MQCRARLHRVLGNGYLRFVLCVCTLHSKDISLFCGMCPCPCPCACRPDSFPDLLLADLARDVFMLGFQQAESVLFEILNDPYHLLGSSSWLFFSTYSRPAEGLCGPGHSSALCHFLNDNDSAKIADKLVPFKAPRTLKNQVFKIQAIHPCSSSEKLAVRTRHRTSAAPVLPSDSSFPLLSAVSYRSPRRSNFRGPIGSAFRHVAQRAWYRIRRVLLCVELTRVQVKEQHPFVFRQFRYLSLLFIRLCKCEGVMAVQNEPITPACGPYV